MAVKSAVPSRRLKAAWIGAGLLCAVVLALLWVTAHQIKDRKMRARYGEKIRQPSLPPVRLAIDRDGTLRSAAGSPESLDAFFAEVPRGGEVHLEFSPGAPREMQAGALESARRAGVRLRFVIGPAGRMLLDLPRGTSVDVEHFTLKYDPETGLAVHDDRGRHVVDFTALEKRAVRRWQELVLTVDERGEDVLTVAAAIRPGAPCSGAGRYHYLIPGLTIEIAPKTGVQILDTDPAKPEVRLRITEGASTRVESLSGSDSLRLADASLRLERIGRSIALVVE